MLTTTKHYKLFFTKTDQNYETAGNTQETNNTVKSTRKAAYGDIGDQLDEIFKDIDAWKTRIQAVKNANPKS